MNLLIIFSTILYYLDLAIEDMTSKKSSDEDSILRKILKVNKNAAVVLVSDLLIAGVDTVSDGINHFILNYQFSFYRLQQE